MSYNHLIEGHTNFMNFNYLLSVTSKMPHTNQGERDTELIIYSLLLPWRNSPPPPSGPRPPYFRGFMITLRHSTVGRNPLDEWSARRKCLYLSSTQHHNRHTFMSPAGFEPTVAKSKRSQTRRLRPHGRWDRGVLGWPYINVALGIQDL